MTRTRTEPKGKRFLLFSLVVAARFIAVMTTAIFYDGRRNKGRSSRAGKKEEGKYIQHEKRRKRRWIVLLLLPNEAWGIKKEKN